MTTQRPEENENKTNNLPVSRQSESTQKTLRFCDECNKLFDLQAKNDDFFPVYLTDDLSICPECQSPLRAPKIYDYIFANKKAASSPVRHNVLKKKDMQRESGRVLAQQQEIVELRKTVETIQSQVKRCWKCGKVLTGKQSQFCSKACSNAYHNKKRTH
jgi:hypothetical protein